MPGKYKLPLSGDVLFCATPLVSFFGTYEEDFDEAELLKAFKMLSYKEPLVGSSLFLDEENNAYAVVGKNKAGLVFLDTDDEEEFFNSRKCGTFDPFSHFFEFYVLNGKTLVIFANAAVSDVKSLFLISERLLSFYKKELLDITPSRVFVYSEAKDIPQNASSVVSDKLSSDLEMKWQEHPKYFKRSDYDALLKKQRSAPRKRNVSSCSFDAAKTAEIKALCENEGVDVATYICFSFKKAAQNRECFKSFKRKSICIGSDLRLFEEEPRAFGVGPFFSRVSIVKDKKKQIEKHGELKAFHDNCYKKLTNAFYAYYDKVFLSGVSPSLSSSAHFFAEGLYKNKASKSLAKNYTALKKSFFTFDFFNLDLKYWEKLKSFKRLSFFEQSFKNTGFYVTAVMRDEKLYLSVEANENVCKKEELLSLLGEVKRIIG